MLLPTIFLLSAILASTSATSDTLDLIPAIEEVNPESKEIPPDAKLTTLQLVSKYGYNGELHKVTTEDGYILELHRITGRGNATAQGKPVAFVMPGLLASSAAWVVPGPEKGLAYVLANAGYDVWLGNARGSLYSRKHTSSSVLDKEYWDFSWHEIGTRDLPAMIDHVLEITGREKLFYLGHSQGTTAFFVMSMIMTKYQSKIQAMFALAPVAYCSRMTSPIFQFIAKFTGTLNILTKLIGMYEFEPTRETMKIFQELVCAKEAITQPLCSNVLFMFGGFNAEQFNTTLLPIVLGHIPAGASTKQFVHYGQLVRSGKFRQYDHGAIRNLIDYGSLLPPNYDLRKIQVPVSLHYSSNDWLVDIEDVHQLYRELGNPIGKFRVPNDKFTHLDFMWAKDINELLYNKILSLMTRFQ